MENSAQNSEQFSCEAVRCFHRVIKLFRRKCAKMYIAQMVSKLTVGCYAQNVKVMLANKRFKVISETSEIRIRSLMYTDRWSRCDVIVCRSPTDRLKIKMCALLFSLKHQQSKQASMCVSVQCGKKCHHHVVPGAG